MKDYEGDDRRIHQFSNIQHPLLFKPEFLLTSIASAGVAIIMLTLHVDGIDNKAQKAIDKTEHYRELQVNENNHVKESIDDLKDQNELHYRDLKHDINRLLDKELSKIGEL
jgi:hypothetical protein